MGRRLTLDDFIERSKDKHGERYGYSKSVYIGSKKKVDIICSVHGLFSQRASDHMAGAGCPSCANNVSVAIPTKNIQKLTIENISKSNIPLENTLIDMEKVRDLSEYRTQPERYDDKLTPTDFNYYSVEDFHNEFNEYIKDRIVPDNVKFELIDYLNYCEINKPKNYIKDLKDEYENSNINIVFIYIDTWFTKKDVIKSRIDNICGMNIRLYARKCVVKEIKDTKIVGEFLNRNHLQGSIGSSVKLGLYYEDKLVSLMTFGKLRRNLGQVASEGSYELLRFCNDRDYSVIGSASKLFKYFIRNYDPEMITSYADRGWSIRDNVYLKLGLNYEGDTQPSYFYIKGHERIGRFSYRKDELLKYGYDGSYWTEHSICLSNRIFRIFDAGCFKYKWIKNT